jgi:hypothetical protein
MRFHHTRPGNQCQWLPGPEDNIADLNLSGLHGAIHGKPIPLLLHILRISLPGMAAIFTAATFDETGQVVKVGFQPGE